MKTIIFTLVTYAFLGLSSSKAQVGVGTTTPDASAALDVDVSSLTEKKGFLPPRMTEAERDNISNPATGLVIYNTDDNCLDYYGGYGWTSLCVNVGPNEVINSQTGRIWLNKNLGATQVADSLNDPNAFGDLYQWGRAADGHQDVNSTKYTAVANNTEGVANFEPSGSNAWDGQFIIRNGVGTENWVDDGATDVSGNGVDDLWQGVNGVNNPCPTGYKVPTAAEWENEIASWEGEDASAAFASLKLTTAGFRPGDNGDLSDFDAGLYWSSTVDAEDAKRYRFVENFTGPLLGVRRSNGMSIRCINPQD